MIRIVEGGEVATPERQAAEDLRQAILAEWPPADTDPHYQITLIPEARCPGGQVTEVDLVLLAELPTDARFRATSRLADRQGRSLAGKEIFVRSLVVAIEVKDHSPSSVRIDGSCVQVQYQDGDRVVWHDASRQSQKQMRTVKSFLAADNLHQVYVSNLIWLRNVPAQAIPPACGNVLGGGPCWREFLEAVARGGALREVDGLHVLDACAGPGVLRRVERLFAARVLPTELDRRRMERLSEAASRDAVERAGLEEHPGQRLVLLRGGGGTGKTVLLLQLARRLREREAARVLVLTYNRALVADLRRMLALLDLRSEPYGRGIHVGTAHSFFVDLCRDLGLAGEFADSELPRADFAEQYAALKQEALQYLREGAITPADIAQRRDEGAATLSYDYVMVDEGQDWPDDERDLLMEVFSHRRLVVAEGREQLVRSSTPADWRGRLSRDQVCVHELRASLRMKSNLVRFAQLMADLLGVPSAAPLPNEEALGGRVLVVEGDYLADATLHHRLRERVCAEHNSEIDILMCVPPRLVHSVEEEGQARRESEVARFLRTQGLEVWDGADPEVRKGAPQGKRQHRVVQYDSCRGLEGWAVVALALDEFYRHKECYPPAGADPADAAARWTVIPLTRAMDTLVISVGGKDSRVKSALREAHRICADFVEWHRSPAAGT